MNIRPIFVSVFILSQAVSALADEVNLKGSRDRVDLDASGFTRVELDSKLVSEIHYDESKEYAVVKVKGGYYQKCGLSREAMDAWLADENPTQYYLRNVKGAYDCG